MSNLGPLSQRGRRDFEKNIPGVILVSILKHDFVQSELLAII